MGTNPSGGNSRRFGAAFLRNACVLFALLLAAANPAWAKTIYVDTGGNDSFDGTSATNQGGGVGPKMTIAAALAIATSGDVISIEAGTYAETITVNTNNLSFESRPDGTFTTVLISGFVNNATGTQVGVTGAGTFSVANGGVVNLTTGSLTVGAGKFVVPTNVVITRNSAHAPVAGSFVFGANTTVVYTGTANTTTGGELPTSLGTGTLQVNLTGGTPASPRTLTLASGALSLSSGTVTVADANTAIVGTITSTGATFNGPGNVGTLVLPSGNTSFASSATVESITISGGTLNLGGNTLTIRGNFTRTSGGLGSTGSLAFVGGSSSATFAAGPNFSVQNLTIGGGAGSVKNLTFTQDVTVTGNFNLMTGSTANLGDRTITFASAGTFTANGPLTASPAGGVVFTVAGATLDGTGSITNIDIVTGGGSITAAGNTTFTGTLSLTNGGINVTGDLSAADPTTQSGSFARVLINISNAATVISGGFNQDNFDYNLDYVGTQNAVRVAGTEFDTNDINNLLVNVRGTGTLDASGRPAGTIAGSVTIRSGDDAANVAPVETFTVLFPTAAVIVNGSVTVEEDAVLNSATSIRLNAASNTVAGTLDGGGQILLGNGVTVNGASAATAQASLGNVEVVASATATVTGVKVVTGNVLTNANSALSLGLLADGGATATNQNAGNVNGTVTLNGNNLTLTSNVEFTNATFNANAGAVTIGANDLVLSNAGVNFVLASGGTGVSASTGRVIFVSTGTVTANGKTIPNLVIGDDVANPTALVVSTSFVQRNAGAEITGAGNLTLSGTGTFAGGNAISGTGTNFVNGFTAALSANTTFSSVRQTGNFTLTGGNGTNGTTLLVTGLYRQDAGELGLGLTNIALSGTGLAYDYNAGTVTSSAGTNGPSGFFEFRGAGTAQTYDLASALTIPYFRIDNPGGTVTAVGTLNALTISQRIMLRNGVLDAENSASTPTGDLVFGNGVTIVRWSGASLEGNDTPTFGTGLIYEYGDTGVASGALTTGRELFPTAGTISTLRILDATTLADNAVAPGSGTNGRAITVTDTLRLAATLNATGDTGSDDDFVTLAPNGTLVLQGTATSFGSITNDAVAATNEVVVTTYTLEYRDYNNNGAGTAATASVAEFPAGGAVANLVITQRATAFSPATLMLPAGFTRQVSGLTIRAGQLDINGNRFSVTGNADLSAGLTMPFNGATVTNALVSGVAGGTLAFEGANDATLTVGSNGGSTGLVVSPNLDVRINKGTDSSEVVLQGGFLDFAANSDPLNAGGDRLLYLDRGILVAGTPEQRSTIYVKLVQNSQNSQNINQIDRGQGFVIDQAGVLGVGREAYVSGNVIKEFSNDPNGTAGTGFIAGRVVYPVGDRHGNYSPLTLDFESNSGAAAQSFSTRRVTVNFVDMRPAGSLGFPIVNGVSAGQNVTNYANFHWFIASDPALGSGTQFNVEARAEGYRLVQGENISTLRLVRRETGDVNQNAFTLVGTNGSYQNFLIDPNNTPNNQADDIPVVLVQGASAFLSPAGSIFTFGNQRGEVNPPPPPAVNVAQLQVAHLAPNAPSPVDVYVNGTLVADNLNYLTATSYQTINNVNGTANLTVAIAPGTSTSAAQAIRTVTVAVSQGQSYFVGAVDDGADATAGNAVDVVVRQSGATSSQAGRTEFFGLNAVAGLPAPAPVDFRVVSGAQQLAVLFRNVAFGQTSGTEVVDPATFGFDVVKTGTTTRLVANQLVLGPTAGERGVLAFVGNATDNPLSPSRNKQLIFIRPNGTVLTGRNITGTEEVALPTEFALKGAFPNPFSSRAAVRFDLPTAGEVSLVVVDMMGREVMRVPATAIAAGANQRIELDGQGLAAGMYFFRLTAATAQGTKVASGQITLVK